MKNHTNDCEVTTTGVCTCQPEPKARRHDDSCASWTGGICTCHVSKPKVRLTTADREDYRHRFGHEPTMRQLYEWKQNMNERTAKGRAGTSRHIDTEPRVTWLGDQRLVHPPTCGVYKSPEPNWAPYCDCFIALKQRQPPIDPDPIKAGPGVTLNPGWVQSRAPWWVWSLIGFGAGFPLGAWAGWPSW